MVPAQYVLRHRSPGDVEPRLVETGHEEARIAVPHVELAARGVRQAGDSGFGDPVGSVAAAREPYRVDRRVGHHLAQCRETRLVRPREMAVAEEALRMDHKLAVAACRDDGLNGLRGLALQWAARCDHRDLHTSPNNSGACACDSAATALLWRGDP